MELNEQLRRFKVLGELDDQELERIAEIARVEERAAGDQIAAETTMAHTLYLVLGGRVDIRISSPGGKPVTIDSVGPGETFGWSAVVDSHTFTAATWVAQEARMIAINGDALRALFEDDNRIGYRVLKGIIDVVSRRVHALRSKLAAGSAAT
jgi:CRP-like cAMP-binding protein